LWIQLVGIDGLIIQKNLIFYYLTATVSYYLAAAVSYYLAAAVRYYLAAAVSNYFAVRKRSLENN